MFPFVISLLDYYGNGETLLDFYGKSNKSGFGGVNVQTKLSGQPWSIGRSVDWRSCGSIWFVDFFFFFFFVGCGPIWPWFVGFFPFLHAVFGGDLVRLLLIFFSLLLFVVAVDLAGGSDGGWMWWLWYGWVDVVADGADQCWVEKERDRDRDRERKNKKW